MKRRFRRNDRHWWFQELDRFAQAFFPLQPTSRGDAMMSEKLRRFQARARELARSGKFNGSRQISFELQFEEGFTEAFQWVYDASTQAELDSICREARARIQAEIQMGRGDIANSSAYRLKSFVNFPKGN
jgi:hypothetical protein